MRFSSFSIQVALLALSFFAGCFSSGGGNECTLICAEADNIGCCTDFRMEVACDEGCPSGLIEESMCRTSGCAMCDSPLECFGDRGTGCCDPSDVVEVCNGNCPAGYTPASECTEEFPACECGGREDEDFLPPELITCYQDTGGGCCGIAQDFDCGVCPDGWLSELNCVAFGSDLRPIPPLGCRVDEGGGCCGAYVSTNACGTCPPGSVYETECEVGEMPEPATCYYLDDGGCCGEQVAPTTCGGCPEGAVREGECTFGGGISAPCFEDLGSGCCGDVVLPNGCGVCPAGTLPGDLCAPSDPILPPEPACYEVDDAGCCGDPVMTNQCGTCPTGSSATCRFC